MSVFLQMFLTATRGSKVRFQWQADRNISALGDSERTQRESLTWCLSGLGRILPTAAAAPEEGGRERTGEIERIQQTDGLRERER